MPLVSVLKEIDCKTCCRFPPSSLPTLQHYAHALLPVWMCNSERPDLHGLAQFCVPALVYIAQEHFTHKGNAKGFVKNSVCMWVVLIHV